MACSVLPFPLVGIPRDALEKKASAPAGAARTAPRRASPTPSQSIAQRLQEADARAAEQLRQALAIQAAYRNGETAGYRAGFVGGATYHRLIGGFYGVAIVGVVVAVLMFIRMRPGMLW
jgi:hypothetical protein